VFSGVYQHQIDAKGRTSLPASFRDVLAGSGDDKVFVTVDLFENYLQAYAPEEWVAFTQKVAAMPQFAETTRALVHGMIAPAHACPFDKLGRIILPTQLRDHAALRDEVVWAGAVNRIELWEPGAWKKRKELVRSPAMQERLKSALENLR
jgi:MraZ protein